MNASGAADAVAAFIRYSAFSAAMGSTRFARSAGTTLAAIATTRSTAATPASTSGSFADVS